MARKRWTIGVLTLKQGAPEAKSSIFQVPLEPLERKHSHPGQWTKKKDRAKTIVINLHYFLLTSVPHTHVQKEYVRSLETIIVEVCLKQSRATDLFSPFVIVPHKKHN